ncbi:MAG: molybdopterin-dependent oxidoreductase [Candidatus Bathyarchaeia archaeon]
MNYVETVCPRDCYDTCFMKVYLNNKKGPFRIVGCKGNPITQGFLCPRGVMDIKRAYSPMRVLYPHKRVGNKPNGKFERISWDEALDIIVGKLKNTLEKFGPSSVLHLDYSGNMGLLTLHLPQRLFYYLGFSQTDLSICSKSGHEALTLHYGLSYGINPEELPKMKLIVYWGFNAAVSAPHLYALSLKARKCDGKIVVIDPRKSETAKSADFWLQPKPGSDVALAYGVMKHLIQNNLVDFDFIEKHTFGFEKLKEKTAEISSKSIEQATGLKWNAIEKLAEFYANLKPNATMIGLGIQKSLLGAEAVRAVSLIPALIGLHRGFFYTNSRGWNVDLQYLKGENLMEKCVRVVSQVALGKHLEKGEFKFVYIYNMNPAETLPNQRTVRKGLMRNDVFVVVHDTHWTETARHADVVLPAATFLEKDDIVVSYSHNYVRKSNKVIEPLGESKSELWVAMEIAKRLNIKEKWLYDDAWETVEKAFGDSFENGSFQDLMNGKTLRLKAKPKDEYQTPTGKIELYSTVAEKLGFSALPMLPQQCQTPGQGGFILLNTAVAKYTHTQFQDVYGPLPPIVLLNPKDAKQHSIKDGDPIKLFNKLGSVGLRARISNAVPAGVLWTPRECNDLDNKPLNMIVPDTTQTIGGGPIFNTTIVKICKANKTG